MKSFLFFIGPFIVYFATAQNYNYISVSDVRNGGFEKIPFDQLEMPPGMLLVEGSALLSGSQYPSGKNVMQPFYISAFEETNGQYLAYLHWLKSCFSKATYEKALPDTTVWLREYLPDTLKDRLMKTYLRAPYFKDYPVVGVSPEQVQKYAIWKSDRMNEMILICEGLLEYVDKVDSTDYFSTASYLAGKWGGQLKQKLPSFDEQMPERDVRMEDGIFLPYYRMVTVEEYRYVDYTSRIVVPEKIMSNKVYNKGDHFGYLFVKPVKTKDIQKSLTEMSLFPVHRSKAGYRMLNDPNNNVSEWAVDTAGTYAIAGASWKYRYLIDMPFYSYSEAKDFKKAHPDDFSDQYPYEAKDKELHRMEGNSSAAVGFRLAMDYRGPLAPPSKRKR